MADLWIQYSRLAEGGFGRVMWEQDFKEARNADAKRITQLEADRDNWRTKAADLNGTLNDRNKELDHRDDERVILLRRARKAEAERNAAFKNGMLRAAEICEGMQKEIVCPEECAAAIRSASEQEQKL